MAKKMMAWSVWVSGMVVLALIVSPSNAVVECGEAVAKLVPCLGFVVGSGPGAPSSACCSGAQELDKSVAASQPDRKALCECLKKAATAYPNINFDRANQLPKLCSLPINVTISTNVDCDKV